MILPQIGEDGQRKLAEARVAVIGLGALGSLSSSLLARAGVGHLVIVDRDVVELDNLQRQLLYDERDIGEAKALVAQRELSAMNSSIEITSHPSDLNPANISRILDGLDVVVDGLDNMKSRFLVNDHCVKTNTPFVYGGAVATYGMMMTIVPGRTACFECLFPSIPRVGTVATCETEGILNTVPATISSVQVAEVLRLLVGDQTGGKLLTFDAWQREFNEMDISRNPECPSCGKGEFRHLTGDGTGLVASLCGRDAVSISPKTGGSVDFDALEARLSKAGEVRRGDGILILSLQDYRITVFKDGRALISGTGEVSKAKSLYSQFIGD